MNEAEGDRERFFENVALIAPVYDALSVMLCPDSMLPVFVVKVQLGPETVPVPLPVQSLLQCPAVPLSAQSSHFSSGLMDRVCRARKVPA